MKTSIYSIFLLLILISGCKKDEDTGYNVSGKLMNNGVPVKNASVNIDGLEQYKATTNADGFFSIEKVSQGKHTLNTKQSYEAGNYVQKSYDIELNNDLNLNALILPNPVLIESVTLDPNTNIATVIWNKSYAEDFREYKLYSHSSSGLDETTGILQHVTIDPNDTIKTVQLDNAENVFFRVFVLNDYGQLGGSNIVAVQSVNQNAIPGGQFDNDNDLSAWTLMGAISIDSSDPYNGTGAVFLNSIVDTVDNEGWNRFPISTTEMSANIDLESNKDYEISFQYRVSGFAYMMFPITFLYIQDNTDKIGTTLFDPNWPGTNIPQTPFKILDDSGWLHYSQSFTSESDASAVFHIISEVEKVWIDDLAIKVVE